MSCSYTVLRADEGFIIPTISRCFSSIFNEIPASLLLWGFPGADKPLYFVHSEIGSPNFVIPIVFHPEAL